MVRVMDLVTPAAILPLLLGCVGLFSLFKLRQRVRMKAYIQDAVVVITGATSGLGRGRSWRQCWWPAGALAWACRAARGWGWGLGTSGQGAVLDPVHESTSISAPRVSASVLGGRLAGRRQHGPSE